MWQVYQPVFDYQKTINDTKSPWYGHIFFAYDLVRNKQPQVITELGTHKGTSFYAFLQAVKDDRLETQVNAIDCWEGDENAGYIGEGKYGHNVYEFVKHTVSKYYEDQNASLIRKYFADAVSDFADKSIDILHIDGLHTYDAVKEDYELWSPKVKDDGVILFHDTAEERYEVGKVWEEVVAKEKEAFCINFPHNHGLGVVIRDKKLTKEIHNTGVEFFVNYYVNTANLHKSEKKLDRIKSKKWVRLINSFVKTMGKDIFR